MKADIVKAVHKALRAFGVRFDFIKSVDAFSFMLEGADLDTKCLVWVDSCDLNIVSTYEECVKEGCKSDLCQAVNDTNYHLSYGNFVFDESDKMVKHIYCYPYLNKKLSKNDVVTLLDSVLNPVKAMSDSFKEFLDGGRDEGHDDTDDEELGL